MAASLTVDPDDPTPPYEQLRRQLAELIDLGQLAGGERLPALRQLAGDLGLAVGTVGRAYAELESAGYLVSRRGAGTRVAERTITRSREEVLDQLIEGFLARTRAVGLSDGEVRERLAAMTD